MPVHLELTDTRRLTGPNLLLPGAGAVIEVEVRGLEIVEVTSTWERELRSLLTGLGWSTTDVVVRPHAGGAALAFSAPIDVLYAACEVNEAAWAAAVAMLTNTRQPDRDDEILRLSEEIRNEADPRWSRLADAARLHGVAFLWDDDEVSVGLGRGSTTWAIHDIPAPDDVDWDAAHDVPVAIVTGTNGKSTTVRMLATVLRTAGLSAGLTSTDGIHVGDEVVETGDFSGPGGARTLMRHPRVDVGILEVARGGMLRRGLPIDHATVATVTNISDDHLGEYGIDDVEDLADAKLVVGRAVAHDGVLLLNADDPLLVSHAPTGQRLAWYSLDPDNPTLVASIEAGGRGWTVVDEVITEVGGDGQTPVIPVAEVPATVNGAARHNVSNALGVVGLARHLGVDLSNIADGLQAFRGDDADNPGRANRFSVDGARVIVDFAHNPAGMRAILGTAAAIPAARRLVLLGQAGDRSDQAIGDLARTAWATSPDRVIAIDIPDYLRGREPMEVPGLIRDAMVGAGASADAIEFAPDPMAGVRAALDWAQPGDLLLLMVLDKRGDALDLLRELGQPAT